MEGQNLEGQEDANAETSDSAKKIIELVIIWLVVGFSVTVFGFFIWSKFHIV